MTFGIIYPDISFFFGVARIFRIEEILVGGFWNLIRYPSAESKSGIHFRLPATETPDNTENLLFFGLSRVSGSGRRKWISDSDYTPKNTWIIKWSYFLYAVQVNFYQKKNSSKIHEIINQIRRITLKNKCKVTQDINYYLHRFPIAVFEKKFINKSFAKELETISCQQLAVSLQFKIIKK